MPSSDPLSGSGCQSTVKWIIFDGDHKDGITDNGVAVDGFLVEMDSVSFIDGDHWTPNTKIYIEELDREAEDAATRGTSCSLVRPNFHLTP